MLPAFRPDKALAVDKPEQFQQWVKHLAAAANMDIDDFDDFLEALKAATIFSMRTAAAFPITA